MATHSLDSVLADVDASDQEITNEQPEAEVGASQEVEAEAEPEADQGQDAHGALHAERNRVRRKYTDTVADFERKLSEVNGGFEKKLSDTLAERDRQWEQRFNQFAQQIQPRQEPKQEVQPERPDIFENPDGFLKHGLQQALSPVEQRISQITETYSRRDADREFGADKVQAAYNALAQAVKSGDQDANAVAHKVQQSTMPYQDIMAWHQRSSVISEVGSDPVAYREKIKAEIMAELQAGQGAPPAQQQQRPASQSLPSLNRVTAAADQDEEEDDPREVFNSALRSGVRR